MQPLQYVDLGFWGYLSNIISIVSYLAILFSGGIALYLTGKFLFDKYKKGELVENRLLASVAIVILGATTASMAHLISRIDYTMKSGNFLVPFSAGWVNWLFTIGHFVLALAMINLLVVFLQDSGICPVKRPHWWAPKVTKEDEGDAV